MLGTIEQAKRTRWKIENKTIDDNGSSTPKYSLWLVAIDSYGRQVYGNDESQYVEVTKEEFDSYKVGNRVQLIMVKM